MRLTDYLNNNDFEFIDRVGFSTNERVSRTVCFKRLSGRNSSSGKVTFFKVGTVSYSLQSKELGCKDYKALSARHTSLEKLDERISTIFG
jgi:hypothetical protein